MGIQGLLPLLKSIAQPAHISSYRGEKVAIDGFAWLHRGAHNCATELALNQPTDKHIKFCLSRIRLLIENGVKPVLVFDGQRLPMKGDTDGERSDKRRQERAIGMQLHESGQDQAAFKSFQRAVSITASAAKALQLACKAEFPQVECIWAPFEADAQLAYLTKINYVKAVISEDSDLIVFGTSCVLYKMDAQGGGSEIRVNNLANCTELALSSLTHQQFQQIAVMAGCDYLPSLSGMGMKKAHALIRSYKTWERAIRKVKLENKTRVHPGYEEAFERALLCFKHQTVFDPVTNQQTSLHPIDEDTRTRFPDLSFLGSFIDNEVAIRMSRGEISPETLEPYVTESLLLHRSQSFTMVPPSMPATSFSQENTPHAPVQRMASLPPRSSATASLRLNTQLDAYFVSSSSAASKPFVAPRKLSQDEPRKLSQDEHAVSSQEDPEPLPSQSKSSSRLTLKRTTVMTAESDNKRVRVTKLSDVFSSFNYLPPVVPQFTPVEDLGSATFHSVQHAQVHIDKENCSDNDDYEDSNSRPLLCNSHEQRFTVERRVTSRDVKRSTSVVDRVFESLKPRTATVSIFDQFRFKTRSPSPTLPATPD